MATSRANEIERVRKRLLASAFDPNRTAGLADDQISSQDLSRQIVGTQIGLEEQFGLPVNTAGALATLQHSGANASNLYQPTQRAIYADADTNYFSNIARGDLTNLFTTGELRRTIESEIGRRIDSATSTTAGLNARDRERKRRDSAVSRKTTSLTNANRNASILGDVTLLA